MKKEKWIGKRKVGHQSSRCPSWNISREIDRWLWKKLKRKNPFGENLGWETGKGSIGSAKRRCKDDSWTLATSENYGAHCGWASAKWFHTHCVAVKTKPPNKYVLELQQKTRKIIHGTYLLSFSFSSWNYIFLCVAKVGDPVHTEFLSSRRLLKDVK